MRRSWIFDNNVFATSIVAETEIDTAGSGKLVKLHDFRDHLARRVKVK